MLKSNVQLTTVLSTLTSLATNDHLREMGLLRERRRRFDLHVDVDRDGVDVNVNRK